MTQLPDNRLKLPEGRVQDATEANWVDRYAPDWARLYLRLSRADRPIGTWLLLLPCWWGILLGVLSTGWRVGDIWLIIGCTIGAFLMRGAGCTWNDLIDRDIDGHVERTRSRPLPSGQVTPGEALRWAIAQSLLAFLILITFNWTAIALGVLALVPVAPPVVFSSWPRR